MQSQKKFAIASIILAFVVVLSLVLFLRTPQQTNVTFSLKAAIIDQLGGEFPNPTFVSNATDLLKNRGFNVSYFNESLNVNFYRGLAKGNYGILILRVHMALREDGSTVDLFTSEEFNESRYRDEREDGLLTRGEYLYRPGKFYFALTTKFIGTLENRFPKSIIFAMGCWSLKPTEDMMAYSFIFKGAKAYIGWNETVTVNDTDHETLQVLEKIAGQNMTLGSAVAQTNFHIYEDPDTHERVTTQLDVYPRPLAVNLTLSQLIAEAETSKSQLLLNNQESFPSLITNPSYKPKVFSTGQTRKTYYLLIALRNQRPKLATQKVTC